jgi:IS605 OrfB family transposase
MSHNQGFETPCPTATIGTVVVEDFDAAGMLRNRRLARSIADAGFGEIRRQLAYKTRWNGGRLVGFPSWKTCSTCRAVIPTQPSRRVFRCEHCGLVIDRDRNAAINLKHQVAQSGWRP